MAHLSLMKFPATLFAMVIAVLSLASCTVTYQFDPIEAWVVDAETGKPIEGAVVTANWELVKGSLDGARYFGQLEVKETVTDQNGRFSFDGFNKEDASGAELRESDPQVLVFKAGYKFERFTNDYRDGGTGLKKLRRTAAVNGKTVRLQKAVFMKGEAEYPHSQLVNGELGFIRQNLPGRRETEKCYWQNVPRMILETRKQELSMRSKGIGLSSLYDYLVLNSDALMANATVPCVSPKQLFLTVG